MGATSRSVLHLVLKDGMRQLAIGLVLGLVMSFGVMRALREVLIDVSPADPATTVAASLILVLAAVLGCYIPARRAMRVDPAVALRHE